MDEYTEVTNVWASKAATEQEAKNLQLRAEMLIALRKAIHAKGWTPDEAAVAFGIDLQGVDNILNGGPSLFEAEHLLSWFLLAGGEYNTTVVNGEVQFEFLGLARCAK